MWVGMWGNVQGACHACPAPRAACSLLAGIRQASPDSQYALCLDDDVLLHPGLLASLVRDMEADAGLFMATGALGWAGLGWAGLGAGAVLVWRSTVWLPGCHVFVGWAVCVCVCVCVCVSCVGELAGCMDSWAWSV